MSARGPVNYTDERDRRLEQLAEDIHACADELEHLRAEYARVEQWQPEYDVDPGLPRPRVDPRLFDLGADSRPMVEVGTPRRIVDVATGGRT